MELDIQQSNNQPESKVFLWKNTIIPAMFSLCAFGCFLFVYWLLTVKSYYPIYFLGLFFALPSVIFALIAYFAGKNKIRNGTAIALTLVLVPIFMIVSFYAAFFISLAQTSASVTNPARYERTMKLGGYSTKEQLAVFPDKIPKNAMSVSFYYEQSAWLEYSQLVFLQFSTDETAINEYKTKFERLAIKQDISFDRVFDTVGTEYVKDLSDDFVLYVIINEGSHDRKVSAVAINSKTNSIIFYAYEMRW